MMKKVTDISKNKIENQIFTIRNIQVMIDRDLAELYQVETKVLNQAVKRNIERFPESFRFQLNKQEKNELVTNCDRFKTLKHSSNNPYAYTEQGVAMLSAVLRSDVAIKVSIQIMNAFIEIRKFITQNSVLLERIEGIERKQLQTDHKFKQVFKALDNKPRIPNQGVFYDGQIFDAYELASKMIKSAEENIILIDNYIDEDTLTHLSKKKTNVKILLLTKKISRQLKLDVKKANQQYGDFTLLRFEKSHDRFLILDHTEIYHLGASLKDLGKKWFAFSKLNPTTVESMMKSIEKIVDGG